MTSLQIKNLNFSYKNNVLFENGNYVFNSGMKYGVLGLNGTGKTTLFNILKANIRVPSDTVLLNKTEIGKSDSYFLETSNFYYSNITGREYLNIFDETRALMHFEKVNSVFELPLDEIIEKYSTGMKKKLAIMTMLMYDRPIYLLDEPFNGLDLESNKILETIINLLAEKGKIVLVTSHILDPLKKTCDEIVLLENHGLVSYSKSQFDSLESKLFGHIDEKVRKLIE
jgi:ABC-2 type transport system ATP-binding protein